MDPIYPYSTLFGELGLDIPEIEIDGKGPPRDLTDPQFRIVNPYFLDDASWHELTLELRVAGPADEISDLDERDSEPRVTVVAFCARTNARQATALTRSDRDPSRWSGKIELPREGFCDKVTVDAVLTATIDGVPHRRIGASETWRVYFDEPAVPPIEGTLRVSWAHFKGDEREEVIPERAADDAFYIALEESPPIVFLNRDFEGLPGLLSDDRGRPAQERALRDAEYRRIAAAAWTEIFNVSIANVREPEGEETEPDWPEEDWQEQALRALLPRIYPGSSEAEQLTQAFTASRGEGALMLQALGQLAVTDVIGASRSLRRNLDRLNRKATA